MSSFLLLMLFMVYIVHVYSCKAEIASMQTAWCWESPVPIKRIEMFYLPTYTTSVASWGEPERAVECDMGG